MPTRRETIDQWATRILLHAHAITPCPDHGYMRLRFSHQGLDYAHALAEHDPYPGKSKLKCLQAIDTTFDNLGDECPGCEE